MPVTYVNGALLDARDAAVSAFDHGLLAGDGVFETVLLRAGRPFALRRHLERLERSAVALGIEPPGAPTLRNAVADVVGASGVAEGRIRLTVTAGRGPLSSRRLPGEQTVVVAVEPTTAPAASASVVVVPWRRNERGALAGLKTVSYGENVRALAWAAERGGDEAVFANTEDLLCEGSGSNVFVAIDGTMLTPALSSGCLAGVTRALVLERLGGEEADVAIGRFCAEVVEEAFLASSVRGLQPIASIDGAPLRACPGPLTEKLRAAYLDLLASTDEP